MRRAAAAALLTGALVLAAPLAASAHVHVTPDQATPGQAEELTFAVPNESDSATTTAVRITVPEGLGAVSATAVPGWRDRTVSSGGRVTAVVFTATGGGVGQGATQAFTIRVATLPDTGSIALPVAQTYSDGRVVDWDEPTPASGEEPEHPAPTVYIRDTPPADDDDEAGPTASPSAVEATAATGTGSALPLGLSVAALVVALGALVVGVLALLRRR